MWFQQLLTPTRTLTLTLTQHKLPAAEKLLLNVFNLPLGHMTITPEKWCSFICLDQGWPLYLCSLLLANSAVNQCFYIKHIDSIYNCCACRDVAVETGADAVAVHQRFLTAFWDRSTKLLILGITERFRDAWWPRRGTPVNCWRCVYVDLKLDFSFRF